MIKSKKGKTDYGSIDPFDGLDISDISSYLNTAGVQFDAGIVSNYVADSTCTCRSYGYDLNTIRHTVSYGVSDIIGKTTMEHHVVLDQIRSNAIREVAIGLAEEMLNRHLIDIQETVDPVTGICRFDGSVTVAVDR